MTVAARRASCICSDLQMSCMLETIACTMPLFPSRETLCQISRLYEISPYGVNRLDEASDCRSMRRSASAKLLDLAEVTLWILSVALLLGVLHCDCIDFVRLSRFQNLPLEACLVSASVSSHDASACCFLSSRPRQGLPASCLTFPVTSLSQYPPSHMHSVFGVRIP